MIQCGYIGLGNIGKPMCANLAKKAQQHGLAMHVFDIAP
ncbi:NAD(P)-binding domain-containing protein [uncultured Spongiibacter sp.]|nr:NAD(P)-binding domain-containing protein [uncultured Spongiibacter sp.]